VLAVDLTAIAGVVAAGRGAQNRARYGWSGRRVPSVAGEPRQVISKFAASTADPDSFTTCAAYTAADGAAPHSPATGTVGLSHRCPKPPGTHSWCHCATAPTRTMRHKSRGVHARPGPRPPNRVHQTVNPKHAHQLRPDSSALWPNAAPTGLACRSSDAAVLTALMSAVEPQ
jgi:hypothetical protein